MSSINYDKKSRAAHIQRTCISVLNEALTSLGIKRPAACVKTLLEDCDNRFEKIAIDNERLRTPREKSPLTDNSKQPEIDWEHAFKEAFAALVQVMIVRQAEQWGAVLGEDYKDKAIALANKVIEEQGDAKRVISEQ